MTFYIFLIIWLASIIIATAIGRNASSFWIGVLLGPIGVLLIIFTGKRCPQCRSRIQNDAKVCPNCREKIEASILKKCIHCSSLIPEDAKICKYCGKESKYLFED
jgi:RNA polymerase subunit RPABC4/transcription elongation factor Spt4